MMIMVIVIMRRRMWGRTWSGWSTWSRREEEDMKSGEAEQSRSTFGGPPPDAPPEADFGISSEAMLQEARSGALPR